MQSSLGRRTDGSVRAALVDGKITDDPRSALTAADLAAQAADVGALTDAWPGLRIIGEEDDSCDVESAANADVNSAEGSVCDSGLVGAPEGASGGGSGTPRLRRDLCTVLEAGS